MEWEDNVCGCLGFPVKINKFLVFSVFLCPLCMHVRDCLCVLCAWVREFCTVPGSDSR